jgi:hypothetical protein
MKNLFSLSGIILSLCIVSIGEAQDLRGVQSDSAVLAVVADFYAALHRGDEAAAQTLFHPQAQLFVSLESGTQTSTAFQPIAEFVRVALEPPAGWWTVNLIDPVAQVSESVAVVWASFIYRAPNQHRCGIEAYQLARTDDRWQIVSIANQTQQSGCERVATANF